MLGQLAQNRAKHFLRFSNQLLESLSDIIEIYPSSARTEAISAAIYSGVVSGSGYDKTHDYRA